MSLHRLQDYYPNYRDTLANGQMDRIGSYPIYTQGEDKVGAAKDLLVDDSGRFRYLVVDTGPWILGKTVLLPIGLAQFDYQANRIYVEGLTKSQVERLPKYDHDLVVDESYEEQVRQVYRPIAQGRSSRQFLGANYVPTHRAELLEGDLRRMPPLNNRATPENIRAGSVAGDLRRMGPDDADHAEGDLRRMPPLGNTATLETIQEGTVAGDLRRMGPIASTDRTPEATHRTAAYGNQAQSGTSPYDRESSFYGLSEEDNHGPLRSYEERLMAQRNRS